MNLIIRKMKKRDLLHVKNVAETSWRATYEGIIPIRIQEEFLSKAYNEKMLKKRRRNTNFFVAEVDGKIVGFANYSKVNSDKSVHLHAIYLLPEFQWKGIGTKLLDYAIEHLDVTEITLDVEHKNKPAIKFYENKGFVKISEFDDDIDGHTIHTIRMQLKVD